MTALDPLDGLSQLQLALTDPSGIGAFLGLEPEILEAGHVAFSLEPRREFANPIGTVHGGIISTLLDSAMACAVHTTLDPGYGYTTLDLHVNFVRATRPGDDRIVAFDAVTLRVGLADMRREHSDSTTSAGCSTRMWSE